MNRLITLLILLLVFPTITKGQTYVVNSLNDNNDGTCDATHCSLREAIGAVNVFGGPGESRIEFTASGEITLTSALPILEKNQVVIDGLTAPSSSCSADPPHDLNIAIDGSAFTGNGIYLGGSFQTVRGLVIKNMELSGVVMAGNGQNKVECSYIGTSEGGFTAEPNSRAILIFLGDNEVVNNLISGNTEAGIYIQGINARDNDIHGNWIGMNSIGSAALPNHDGIVANGPSNNIGGLSLQEQNRIAGNSNHGIVLKEGLGSSNVVVGNLIGINGINNGADLPNGGSGIHILNSSHNIIGGHVVGAKNTISGNSQHGIYIEGAQAENNHIEGNRIGTNPQGSEAIPNIFDGIHIDNAPRNHIGSAGLENTISGNGRDGIRIIGSLAQGNVIRNNRIGLDRLGDMMGNQEEGVYVKGAGVLNQIGGLDPADKNTISGNAFTGIRIDANNTFVYGNFVGTDPTGQEARPNDDGGIAIASGTSSNVIGSSAGGGSNLVSGNGYTGIIVAGSSNIVQSNIVGLNIEKDATLRNHGNGISVIGDNNTIGGNAFENGNTVGGHLSNGIQVILSASNNVVKFNRVGIVSDLPTAFPNAVGIFIQADDNTVSNNYVAGNAGNGIYLDSAHGNQVLDNIVGLGISNTAFSSDYYPLPNGQVGLEIDDSSNNIIDGNVISGNLSSGVELLGENTTLNELRSNLIGLDPYGSTAIGNGGSGILLYGVSGNVVGGSVSSRNVISGNAYDGVSLAGSDLVSGNEVSHNYIGVDYEATKALGNGFSGVVSNNRGNEINYNLIAGSTHSGIGLIGDNRDLVIQGNTIGFSHGGQLYGNAQHGIFVENSRASLTIGGAGPGQGNTIFYNQGDGISVTGNESIDVNIVGNSIHSNGGLGIDLGNDGVTANDQDDADTGPNGLQNYPTISSIQQVNPNEVQIVLELHSTPNETFRVHFYKSPDVDVSTYGEGAEYLFGITMVTGSTGNTSVMTLNLPISDFSVGSWISATATTENGAGSTSEFSRAVRVIGNGLELNTRVFLQGPYVSGMMSAGMKNDLQTGGHLPSAQPYNVAPWNYSGSESSTFSSLGIVDWVLVELRASLAGPPVTRKAGLIMENGDILNPEGGRMTFESLQSHAYYLVIHHRNHLSVASSQLVDLTAGGSPYDFTNFSTRAYGSNPLADLGDGRWGMWSGDGNADGTVTAFDFIQVWLPQNGGSSGYHMGDFNMTGDVSAFDFLQAWIPSNGQSSQVP